MKNHNDTKTHYYTQYLQHIQNKKWKSYFNVQKPYRNKILSMSLGRTLDIGSGIGRTLTWLTDSVGVDHNGHSINRAREQGLICFVNKDFHKSKYALNGYFDSLIFVHVLEHLTKSQADSLLSEFRKYLKPFGKLVIICPQEKGFKSDKTHVTFLNFDSLNEYGRKHQFDLVNKESFPFPRILGKIFRGNEFISVFISKI